MKGEAGGIGAVGFGRGMDPDSSVWYIGNLFTILAGSEDTGGRFGLVEVVSRKGSEPPRHVHHREDEAWYVLEGEISFYIGDEIHRATPGSFVFAPRSVPHSFVFETDVIRKLILLTPGGPEEHFRDPRFSEPAQTLTLPPPPEGPPDVAALVADMERYGVEVVGPPGPPNGAGESEEGMTVRSGKTAGYMRRAELDASKDSGPRFTILADSKDTDKRFSFAEVAFRKGSEPSRHIHHREDEAFYVLEGGVTFYVGDKTFEASPGTFVFMPRDVPHSYTFETGEVRALGVLSPGGFEEFFRDPRTAAIEEYGIEFVGPPGPPEQR